MKILFFTPYLPSPPAFGAQRRLEGLMRGLAARRHEVSLLSYTGGGARAAASLAATKSYCHELQTVQHDVLDVERRRKRLMQLRSLGSRKSFDYWLIRRREMQAALQRMLARDRYDVLQIEFAQMAVFDFGARRPESPRVVLDEHNIEYDLVRRSAEAPCSLPRKLYNEVNWRKLRTEERLAWGRVDGVVLTSARDEATLLADEPSTRTAVVPNAVDLQAFAPSATVREKATLLFLGAVNYYPNTDGILYFLNQVFPRVLARRPDVKLRIVGMNPPESILARRSESVEVTGFVDDPRPLLDQASAVIVPLRIGGGTRFKIVEAMAKGKAIVSTRIGAEGLEVEHERHLLLADSAEDFALQIERVLESPALADRLGQAARQLAQTRYGWDAAVDKLEAFYATVLRR